MANVTMSLKRTKSEQEQRCGACGASFAPIEDSGSRVVTVKSGDQDEVTALMCGGCFSKWTGGATMTLKATPVTSAG